MLQYQASFMQNILELNWAMAKHAHAAFLTEIERGHMSCMDQIGISRIRHCFLYRAMKRQSTNSSEELVRICKRFNKEACSQMKDLTEEKITYKNACFTCFKVVNQHYPHPEAKCDRAKRQVSSSLDKA